MSASRNVTRLGAGFFGIGLNYGLMKRMRVLRALFSRRINLKGMSLELSLEEVRHSVLKKDIIDNGILLPLQLSVIFYGRSLE